MPLIKHSLGVSLEEGSLRVIYLRASLGGREVVASADFQVPTTPEEERLFLQEAHKFLLKNRIRPSDSVTLGIPHGEVIFRSFTTPPVAERELPDLVEFESDRHLPGKKEEFLVGYQHQGRLKEGRHQLLLGATKRSGVERILSLLRKANLPPVSLQPAPLALAAAFAQAHPESPPVILLYLGLTSFAVHFLQGGKLVLTRSFTIERALWKDSLEEPAGEGHLTEGAAERIQAGAQWLAELIVRKIGQPLFVRSLPGNKIPEMYLTGYGTNRSTLVEKLQNDLQVPVRVFSPWLRLRWTGTPAVDSSSLVTATGLALLGLSGPRAGLELSEEREESLRERPRFRLTVALAAIVLFLILANLSGRLFRQRQYLARIDRQVQFLRVKMTAVEKISREVKVKKARLLFLEESMHGGARQADILLELTSLIPDDSYLAEYKYSSREQKLEIAGFAPSASKLLPIIEGSPFFAGVEFADRIVARSSSMERFKIKMLLEKSGG